MIITTTDNYVKIEYGKDYVTHPINTISYTLNDESEGITLFRNNEPIGTCPIDKVSVDGTDLTRDNADDLLKNLFAISGSGSSIDLPIEMSDVNGLQDKLDEYLIRNTTEDQGVINVETNNEFRVVASNPNAAGETVYLDITSNNIQIGSEGEYGNSSFTMNSEEIELNAAKATYNGEEIATKNEVVLNNINDTEYTPQEVDITTDRFRIRNENTDNQSETTFTLEREQIEIYTNNDIGENRITIMPDIMEINVSGEQRYNSFNIEGDGDIRVSTSDTNKFTYNGKEVATVDQVANVILKDNGGETQGDIYVVSDSFQTTVYDPKGSEAYSDLILDTGTISLNTENLDGRTSSLIFKGGDIHINADDKIRINNKEIVTFESNNDIDLTNRNNIILGKNKAIIGITGNNIPHSLLKIGDGNSAKRLRDLKVGDDISKLTLLFPSSITPQNGVNGRYDIKGSNGYDIGFFTDTSNDRHYIYLTDSTNTGVYSIYDNYQGWETTEIDLKTSSIDFGTITSIEAIEVNTMPEILDTTLVKDAFEQIEAGSSDIHLSLHSADRPTVETSEQKEEIAYLSDLKILNIGVVLQAGWNNDLYIKANGEVWARMNGQILNANDYPELRNLTGATQEYVNPTMTANNTPSPYLASSSSQYSATYAPWCAFNRQSGRWFATASGTFPSPSYTGEQWLQLYFGGEETAIDKYIFRSRAANQTMPNTWTLQGSNDGSAWDIIDIRTDYTPDKWGGAYSDVVLPLANRVVYKYYRVVIPKTNSGATFSDIGELLFLGDLYKLQDLGTNAIGQYSYMRIK